jgi:hypothetical protein
LKCERPAGHLSDPNTIQHIPNFTTDMCSGCMQDSTRPDTNQQHMLCAWSLCAAVCLFHRPGGHRPRALPNRGLCLSAGGAALLCEQPLGIYLIHNSAQHMTYISALCVHARLNEARDRLTTQQRRLYSSLPDAVCMVSLRCCLFALQARHWPCSVFCSRLCLSAGGAANLYVHSPLGILLVISTTHAVLIPP